MAENRHGSTGSPRTVFFNLGFCRKSIYHIVMNFYRHFFKKLLQYPVII
ncbi:hypothetical protein [Moraxella lacunata]